MTAGEPSLSDFFSFLLSFSRRKSTLFPPYIFQGIHSTNTDMHCVTDKKKKKKRIATYLRASLQRRVIVKQNKLKRKPRLHHKNDVFFLFFFFPLEVQAYQTSPGGAGDSRKNNGETDTQRYVV